MELIPFGVTYGIVCAKFAFSVIQVSHFSYSAENIRQFISMGCYKECYWHSRAWGKSRRSHGRLLIPTKFSLCCKEWHMKPLLRSVIWAGTIVRWQADAYCVQIAERHNCKAGSLGIADGNSWNRSFVRMSF